MGPSEVERRSRSHDERRDPSGERLTTPSQPGPAIAGGIRGSTQVSAWIKFELTPTLWPGRPSLPAMTVEATATVPAEDSAAPAERITRLFTTHRRRLYALARRLSSSREDACDLVQETFLRAARSPRSIPQGAPNEEAWLVRVLINICRDRWRHSAVQARARMLDRKSVV